MSASSSQASTKPSSQAENDDSTESLPISKRRKLEGTFQHNAYAFDQDEANTKLVNMIILHEYPLSMVEDDSVIDYVTSVQPLFKMPSRKAITKEVFEIYERERLKTMALLEKNKGRISVSAAMWSTDNQKRSFMAISAHFIDDSWILQNRLLRYVDMPVPHTPEVIANALKDCILEWNIESRLSTLTVDDCTDYDAMIEKLLSSDSLFLGRELSNMHCFAHMLNLIVKDGLDVIGESIERVRGSIEFWTETTERKEIFGEMVGELKIESTMKLELDCKMSWSSTYLMLKSALVYKDVFSGLKQRESQYESLPSEENWLLLDVIAGKLELFYNVTELFSKTTYFTANLYFMKICEIRLEIYRWLASDHIRVQAMASKMLPKFEKFWNTTHAIIAIAAILDPRFKMKMVEYYFSQIYQDNAAFEIERIHKMLYQLVKQYTLSCLSDEACQGSVSASSPKTHHVEAYYLKQFDLFLSKTTSADNIKSELDRYLEECLLPRTPQFDILSWWKEEKIRFPTLYHIARDVLAIPVSTIDSKSRFSTDSFSSGERIVSPHRSGLRSKIIEALTCARDWLWNAREGCPSTFAGSHRTLYDDQRAEGLLD